MVSSSARPIELPKAAMAVAEVPRRTWSELVQATAGETEPSWERGQVSEQAQAPEREPASG